MSTCQGSIKVLVYFPTGMNLLAIRDNLIEDFPCLETIQQLTDNQLLISMDSIVELLDIDFVNSYGATSTKLIDPKESTESIKYRLENLNSTLHQSQSLTTPQSLLELNRYFEDLQNSSDNLKAAYRTQRLTSLEDEIVEDQKIKDYFRICPDTESELDWSPVSRKEERPYTTLEEEMEGDQPDCVKKQQQIGWLPILNGIACTALIVGGIKAVSFFFNR